VRRDPFAMLPFIGYNMSDYFQHWLDLGAKLAAGNIALPRIYCVNWFRKGADGKFIWPGYGENMRVLLWIVGRIQGQAKAEDHLMGLSPGYADLNWKGLDFTQAQYRQVTDIDAADWAREVALHAELFEQLAYHMPAPLLATMAEIRKRLAR